MFTCRISLSTVLISICFFLDANYASFFASRAVLNVSFRSCIVFREESWLDETCLQQKFLIIAKGLYNFKNNVQYFNGLIKLYFKQVYPIFFISNWIHFLGSYNTKLDWESNLKIQYWNLLSIVNNNSIH